MSTRKQPPATPTPAVPVRRAYIVVAVTQTGDKLDIDVQCPDALMRAAPQLLLAAQQRLIEHIVAQRGEAS